MFKLTGNKQETKRNGGKKRKIKTKNSPEITITQNTYKTQVEVQKTHIRQKTANNVNQRMGKSDQLRSARTGRGQSSPPLASPHFKR